MVGQRSFCQKTNVQTYIKEYATENQFNGTVLVQKDTVIMYHESYGVADRRFDIPITNETAYKVASITKAFTAVLILQLYEQGKLDLKKSIDNYLPNYGSAAGSKVSVHQLLNHTSGIRQIDTISSIDNALKYGLGYLQKPYTSDQIFNLFKKDSIANTPGEKWEYNNFEYVILGKILEKIYDKSYDEILSEKILKPFGMDDTGLFDTKKIIPKIASTYFSIDGSEKLINDIPVYIENWYAAGALYSSTSNLIKFSNALFDYKLIKKETLNLMLTPHLEEYGYGVWIRGNDDYKVMERYGRIMGANAVWMRFLNKDITVIILSNTNLTNLGELALGIGKELIEPK